MAWLQDYTEALSFNNILVIFLVSLAALYFVINLNINSKIKWPPGPRGFPIIGNLPQIDFKSGMYITMNKWQRVYGNIYKLQFGLKPVLVVSGFDMIHDIFVTQGDKFMDRPSLYLPSSIFQGRGIIFQPFGPLWKEIRRLALKTLRDLGVGKSSLEEKIVDEVLAMQSEILSYKGKPFGIRNLIQNAAANVVCSVNFGTRYEYDDTKFHRLLQLLNEFFASNPVANPVNFFPWTRFIPGVSQILMRPKYIVGETRKLVEHEIEQHRATFDADNIRDFVDVYLKAEQEEMKSQGNSSGVFMDGQLFQTIHDLFNAGSETAATSISWILLYLIRNPGAQKKCHEELDRVVGQNRACTMKDKPNLPYVEACVLESMRKGNIGPLGIAHAARCDVEFRGYYIPKGTIIIPNFWSVHMDEEYWGDPDKWRPDRWIDADTGRIIRHEPFVPFGLGYRVCAGQQLAQMEMFLILTCLLQHFQFGPPPGQPPPPDTGLAGITRRPHDYLLCAHTRATTADTRH